MKITVTFESLEEFTQHVRPNAGFVEETPRFKQAQERVEELKQEAATEEEAPVKPDPEPEAKPAPKAPAVTEDFRVEVRKAMAKLNKQTGQNTAKDLITAIGFTKLSEVPLEMLPDLMEQVKEAANA